MMRKTILTLALLFGVLSGGGGARAEVYYVRVDEGHDGNIGTSWSLALASLTRAADLVLSGDTVAVCASDTLIETAHFTVPVDVRAILPGDSLRLAHAGLPFYILEPELSVDDTLLTFSGSGGISRLRGCVLLGNLDDDGNAARMGLLAYGSELRMENVAVNGAVYGILALHGADLTATRCRARNTRSGSAGIRGYGTDSYITLRQCSVEKYGRGISLAAGCELSADRLVIFGSTLSALLVTDLDAGDSLRIDRATIEGAATGIELASAAGTALFQRGILSGCSTGVAVTGAAPLILAHSLIWDLGTDTTGTVVARDVLRGDPLYAGKPAGDLRPHPASPALFHPTAGRLGAEDPFTRRPPPWGRRTHVRR
jgi:hypothetical protein